MCPYKDQEFSVNPDESDTAHDEMVDSDSDMSNSDEDDSDKDSDSSDVSLDAEAEDDDDIIEDSSDDSEEPQESTLGISSNTRQIRAELEHLIDELSNGIPLDFTSLENLAEELHQLLVHIDASLPLLCPCLTWPVVVAQLHSAVEELRNALLHMGSIRFQAREE